ncbi:MAG: SMC-Scp complex subunit ScpB [Chitinophagaceae bacterium]|nr:SMC-Scp complex subunit ScpB [Chitinophagaceae bacterium]
MTIEQMMLQSEALIFGSDKPLHRNEIERLLGEMAGEEGLDAEKLTAALDAVVDKYSSDFYPFEVKQIGNGYQFLSKKEFYPALAKLNGEKFTKKLSTAAMETLAIIAYRQPITKGDIEHIRGVNSDYSVQKLLEKELIVISGRMEDMVGKPLTYSTSKSFMDYLGINSLDDLPKLNEIIQVEMPLPTPASEASPEIQTALAVTEQGELIEIRADHQEQDPVNG